MRELGTVKWFNATKGYGFITTQSGDDVFVHYAAIQSDGYKTLNEGQVVEFTITQGPKGLTASDVTAPTEQEPVALGSFGHEINADHYSADSDPAVSRLDDLLEASPKSENVRKEPLRVFLCHSSDDKPAVRGLYSRLVSDGIDPWLDENKLDPGVDWQFEIAKAVREAHIVIVCLSQGSINKEGYVQKEIRFSLDKADEKPEGTIFLIPLRLENCTVPDRLSRWQYVDIFEADGYERLKRALRRRAQDLGISG